MAKHQKFLLLRCVRAKSNACKLRYTAGCQLWVQDRAEPVVSVCSVSAGVLALSSVPRSTQSSNCGLTREALLAAVPRGMAWDSGNAEELSKDALHNTRPQLNKHRQAIDGLRSAFLGRSKDDANGLAADQSIPLALGSDYQMRSRNPLQPNRRRCCEWFVYAFSASDCEPAHDQLLVRDRCHAAERLLAYATQPSGASAIDKTSQKTRRGVGGGYSVMASRVEITA